MAIKVEKQKGKIRTRKRERSRIKEKIETVFFLSQPPIYIYKEIESGRVILKEGKDLRNTKRNQFSVS